MATIRYEIPIVLNTETNIGIVNAYNSFIKGKVLYNVLEHPHIELDHSSHRIIVYRKDHSFKSYSPDIVWSFPVSYTSLHGRKYNANNINEMQINVYNDIRRIIRIDLKNKTGQEYNCLYIDPAYGYMDEEEISEYSFVQADMLYADRGCKNQTKVSPEGALIMFTNTEDLIIYSFYQIDKLILVYTNKGIYFLQPIEGSNFFEIIEIPGVGDIDVKSAKQTYATETVSFFVYEKELWHITTNGAKKIGGYNLIKQLCPDIDPILFSNSIGAMLINPKTNESIIYTFENGFTGILNQTPKGIKYSKFILDDDYKTKYPLIIVKNELNDNQFKIIRRIVISGLLIPVYAKLKIMSDISNTQTYLKYNFNNEGVCYANHVCKKLDFEVYVENENVFSQIRNIEVYYEYVRMPDGYRYVKNYEPAW